MALTPTQRKANQRARDKGLPEPFNSADAKANQEALAAKELQYEEYLNWAQKQDETGRFVGSECRSAVKLLAIYMGNNHVSLEEPEEDNKKSGKKKQNIPNPSIQPIRIRAVETEIDGKKIKIDPDKVEHRHIFEVSRVLTFQEWLFFRDKGRRDLYWLANLLGKSLFHDSHQMICDMFVKKDFHGKYYPEFDRHTVSTIIRDQKRASSDGEATRTAMIFAPRGGWKSTIDGIDATQWMLNAPDVRIMIITAFRDLSKQFLKEIKGYFYLPPRGEPSNFQLLYPEYILTGVDGRSREPIECPAAVLTSKEPHVWITSMESSITGKRCDIAKLDDIVDPKNSTDEIMRQALAEKVNGALDLVEPWGFIDIIGTRYFTDDYYGTRMSPDEDGLVAPFSLLSISAWYPKPQFLEEYQELLEQPNGMSKVTEDMVDLWFPFKLDFATLRRKLLEKKERNSTNIQKERSFRNQQLNIATDPMETTDLVVHFSKDVLRSHTYGPSAAPQTGETIVTVDWAYSENKTSDYSVLAAQLRHTRDDGTEELIVKDIDYDKWKSSDLALRIVLFLRKHNPNRTFIEKALGADLLLLAMRANAMRYNCLDVLDRIKWVETGNTKDAKANRIKTLEILLADDRLHFISGPWIDELYRQFERFTGETKKGRKDDIPDCISIATRTLPATMFTNIRVDPEEEQRMLEQQEKAYRKARHIEAYFGPQYSGTRLRPSAPNLPAPTWRERALGRRNDAPPVIEENAPVKPQDPRMVIFGNKGPWRL
jgi:hypothetical protein